MLDDMHKQKIDMAEAIYVINVGGYVGESTRKEIEYAQKKRKRVYFREPTGYLQFTSEPSSFAYAAYEYLKERRVNMEQTLQEVLDLIYGTHLGTCSEEYLESIRKWLTLVVRKGHTYAIDFTHTGDQHPAKPYATPFVFRRIKDKVPVKSRLIEQATK